MLFAKISKVRGKANSFSLERVPLNVKRLDIGTHSNGAISMALSPSETLIRSLDLSLTKESDIEQVLPFELEPLLPFNETEALYDYKILRQSADESSLALYITKKESGDRALEEARSIGLTPITLSLPAAALLSFAKEQALEGPLRGIVFLDKTHLIVVLIDQELAVAQHIHNVGDDFSLRGEVAKALLSLSKSKRLPLNLPVLFLGIPLDDGKAIAEDLGFTPLFATHFFGLSEESATEFAIPLGLALANLRDEEELPNFRKETLDTKELLLSYKKPLSYLAAASFLLTLGIFSVGLTLANNALIEAKKNFNTLLTILEKPYSQVEERPLSALSRDELERRAFVIESTLYERKDHLELYPDVPRVSDILAFFASLPQVTTKGAFGKPTIDFKSFNYTMVKRPDLKNKNERYRVKVDIEFNALSPTAAREFHDFLLLSNDFVDSSNEVKWSTSGDLYKASFFLKNRAPSLKKTGSVDEAS